MIAVGESFTTDTENCECTADGLSCSPINACPEFRKMEGKVPNPVAKAICEDLGGHIAFFKNEAEYDFFRSVIWGDQRQWLGESIKRSSVYIL